jgi:hypothetical protein
MRRMLQERDDVFYYVTIMNESYAQPSIPADAREGILRGMHRVHQAKGARVRLLGAGTILNEALAAASMLEKEWGVASEVHSVTSFTELRREGMERQRTKRACWIQEQLPANGAPVIAACDYVSAVADLIRPWIADRYVVLGTDGFGRSDTRESLRRFFEVDRRSIAHAALAAIGDARGGEEIRHRCAVAAAMDALSVDRRLGLTGVKAAAPGAANVNVSHGDRRVQDLLGLALRGAARQLPALSVPRRKGAHRLPDESRRLRAAAQGRSGDVRAGLSVRRVGRAQGSPRPLPHLLPRVFPQGADRGAPALHLRREAPALLPGERAQVARNSR